MIKFAMLFFGNAYVYGFTDTTGLTAGPDYAKNATDGSYAVLTEEPVGGSNQSDRPTSPIKTITNGTEGGGNPNDMNLSSDGLVNKTIPDINVITNVSYLMNTDNTAVGGLEYWNINMTAGGSANTSTYITISATNLLNYVFRPGQQNNRVSGTPGNIPTGYGWSSSSPVNGTISAGTWNFQVRTNSTITNRDAYIKVYVYKYNATSGTNTSLFNVTGTTSHFRNPNPRTENITSSTQPSFKFNSTEYLKVEYWLYVSTATNGAGLYFEVNSATPFIRNGRDTYSLNTTYIFNETVAASPSWQSISIQDNSYGDPLTNVSIFNNASGLWESLSPIGFSGGTTPAQHVNTVVGASGNASDYDAGSGQIKIKYNWTGSTQNNTLGVDLLNVTVNYAAGGVYRLNITSNTTGIPNTTLPTNHELQIKYYVSGDNFTLQVWNGAAFVNQTTLNKTSPDYYNYTLSSNELKPDGKTTDGTVGDIDQNYVLVRYVDLTSNGVQGNLYLDYQRVYSW
ncbi:MAG: hypothetical protein Q8M95_16875 [Candidatus Methanoperedens sp.]|nr:hypothetical protein [Candidatus Methanoperedens sp.]